MSSSLSSKTKSSSSDSDYCCTGVAICFDFGEIIVFFTSGCGFC